jgi:hypothetical protein
MVARTSNNSTSSGSATLTGLAILENPCTLLNQPMTVHFDAQFYLAPECTAIASLRYFNSARIDFESKADEFPAQYVVCASIAQTQPGMGAAMDVPDALDERDYNLVGDIVWMFPVQSLDPAQRAWINVTGLATNINNKDSTFDVEPNQYTSTLSKAGLKSQFSARLHFPEDDARYKNRKPMPSPRSYVAIQGFLSRVEQSGTGFSQRFHVDLDHVTFLGRPGPAIETQVPVPAPNGSVKRKLAGSFTPSRQSEAPSSPSPYRTPTGPLRASSARDTGNNESPGSSQTLEESLPSAPPSEAQSAAATHEDFYEGVEEDNTRSNRASKRLKRN